MEQLPHVLLVDDEDEFRTLIATALKNENYVVTDVASGEDALRVARTQSFDLALLDMRMPGMGGVEVLTTLQKESPQTDCIMITGYQDIQLAVEAIKQGAKEFLTKPVNITDLIRRLKSVRRTQVVEARARNLQAKFTIKLLHDLLTPLHSVTAAVEFLEKGSVGSISPQQKSLLQTINTTICNMDAVLNDMIDLSLFESGEVELEKIPTNVDELIQSVCSRFKSRASAKKIPLTVRVDDNVPTVSADPDKIEQVMNNILENAITYTPEGGKIAVHVSIKHRSVGGHEGEVVEVTVSDSGIGISKGELLFVFDKYREFLTGKTSDQKKTGLGLAICRNIVEAHNGTIDVESELGKGSTFKFLLPVD
ncbi:MAG: response regulator [Ignavibacteria bacterium]|nr:response regulator [Ignavibacteria bacterium]